MATVSSLSVDEVQQLASHLEGRLQQARTLEAAAQTLAEGVYEACPDSTVLARVFATVPYARVPDDVRTFVHELASAKGIAGELTGATQVLCLLGTCGRESGWKDRRASEGHVGIPLASTAFVDEIPMISRLLNALGVPMAWVDGQDTEIVSEAGRALSGLFYVEDAATELDARGRNIIAAQDFVSAHGVKTVFGVGTTFAPTGPFLTLIVFTDEAFDKGTAERFLPLADLIRRAAGDAVSGGWIFASD